MYIYFILFYFFLSSLHDCNNIVIQFLFFLIVKAPGLITRSKKQLLKILICPQEQEKDKIYSKRIGKHKYIYNQLTKPTLLGSLTRRGHPNEARAWVKNVDKKVEINE